ncbi:hypothetical protein K3181_01330 [Qipengyuania sp. YG27]|uniref:Peptidase C39-like domain-containing protein n=1 Tax=Qipengyuania mesophila TaxID=2867246 RepID=A0ABS7JR31_9SPHN|nr:hypothetical protein [Qipengyuania mesophila]MBX7500082.1 hypothetical protein [Qipengyuania mesophila]
MSMDDLVYDALATEKFSAVPLATAHRSIAIDFDDQQCSNWCWAAVGLELCRVNPGTSFGHRSSRSQADLVMLVQGSLDDTPRKVGSVVSQLRNAGWLGARYYRRSYHGDQLRKELRDSIDAGNPASAVITWRTGLSHNVCVFGYITASDGSYSFWVYDPSATDLKSDNRYLLSGTEFDRYPGWDAETGRQIFGFVDAVYTAARE